MGLIFLFIFLSIGSGIDFDHRYDSDSHDSFGMNSLETTIPYNLI
jgi:hypothetical protein